jgi:hypothetical protein
VAEAGVPRHLLALERLSDRRRFRRDARHRRPTDRRGTRNFSTGYLARRQEALDWLIR